MKAAPLRLRAVRRAIVAPDLERYLDPRNIDLVVTDQVQAVRVRVKRGLEVFDKRLRSGLALARLWLGIGAALLPLCAGAGWLAARELGNGGGASLWRWIPTTAAAVAGLWAASVVVRAGLDLERLRRASRRFTSGELDPLETSREVLAYGEAILEEARALGAAPRRDG